MERLVAHAREVGGPAVVLTFDPHPVRLLRPDAAPPPLTWTDRKAQLLGELGVDGLIAYPTDERLLGLSPTSFFESILRDRLGVRAMVEGPNFYFGHDRAGDIHFLGELCRQHHVQLEVVPPLVEGGSFISSSRIRMALAQGDVAFARQMLTHPYRIRGMVTHGAARGARIGFPTANLDAIDTLLPPPGVYAGQVEWNGQRHLAAINIGTSPTFADPQVKVEVHILDFHGSLYGQPLEVDFYQRLRDIEKFSSAEALVQQLRQDVVDTRQVFPGFP